MQVTFETRARSAAHFCPFVKPFSEKFVGDFVKNESLSPVFSRDRDSERLYVKKEEAMRRITVSVQVDAEKLRAIQFYAGRKDSSLEAELEDCVKKVYEKYVPLQTREYIESMAGAERSRSRSSRTAPGTEGTGHGQ